MRLLAFLAAFAAVSFAGVFQASADIPPPYTEYTIGVSLAEGEPFPKIDAVTKGGPAAKAGVKVGDLVIGLNGVALYAAAGAVFAVAFLLLGITRIDNGAKGAGLGFRLLLIPGLIALWPLMLIRWLSGGQPHG